MTKKQLRARLIRVLVRAAIIGVAARAGWVCDAHHLPLLLTLALSAALFVVFDQGLARLTIAERTLTCPKRCGFTITAPREDASRYQAVLAEHERTDHPVHNTVITLDQA